MRLFRQIVFYAFVLLYLVLCPVTVFSTLGYVFIPGAEQQIVKTGLIYLASTPPGATVYVGRRRFVHRTPTILRGLRPGAYDIRLVLKGHESWAHTVPVEAEKAAVLEHVLLLPKPLRFVEIVPGPFEDLLPVTEEILLLQRSPLLGDLLVYEPRAKRVWPLLEPGSPLAAARVIGSTTVPKSERVVLEVISDGAQRLLWVDLSDREPRIQDLSGTLARRPLWVTWDPNDHRYLFAFEGGAVHRLDLTGRAYDPAFVDRVSGMGLFLESLYLLREHGVLERMDLQGDRSEVVWRHLTPAGPPAGGEAAFRVRLLSETTVLLWGRRGELHSNRAPYELVPRGVRGLVAAPKQPQVLLWQRDRLGILDHSGAVEGGSTEETPRLRWIYQQGRDIQQAFWAYDGSHGVIRDDDRALLLDLEASGTPRQQELFRIKRGTSIAYAEDAGVLYYLDPASGSLMACELLPKREMLPLPFPDRGERPVLREP